MRSFNDYVEQAKDRAGIPSDNKLARRIGIASPSLCQLKQGQSVPSAKTLRELAGLAGIAEEEAALDLARWRAEREGATWMVQHYERMFRHITGGAALILCLLLLLPSAAKASTSAEQINRTVVANIHYATLAAARRLRKWLLRLRLALYTPHFCC